MLTPFVPAWLAFNDFSNTVPQIYWNIQSNEQRYHFLCKELHKLVCYAEMMGEKINLDHAQIDALEAEFEKFKESGFADYYAEQIEQWVNDNMAELYRLLVRQVYFGLTTDGYFVAYIPESWEDIIFDTSVDPEYDTYGRLVLRMNVDTPTNVDQTPERI